MAGPDEARNDEPKRGRRARGAPAWAGWAALGGVVLALSAVVIASLPKAGEGTTPVTLDAGDDVEPWHDEALVNGPGGGKPTAHADTLDRPAEATCDLAIVVEDRPDLDVRTTREAIARSLDARHCGAACDAVKKVVLDEARFDLDRLSAEELVLPPKDTWDTVAATLTTEERASLDKRTIAIVVRTRGQGAPDHLPARAAFAVTAALAEQLSGIVWDETLRRFAAPRDALKQAITVRLGEPVLTPRHLVIQVYRQEDGSPRMLTLGMGRFASPDFSLRTGAMGDATSLGLLLNAAAAKVAAGTSKLPLTVGIEDLARVAGVPARELAADPARSKPAVLDAVEPPRTEGDPDNEMAELVPPGGVASDAWASVLGALLVRAPQVAFTAMDGELEAVATRARRDLASAVKKASLGSGTLFVKGPFPVKADAGVDAGAEWMWIEAQRCDARACTGPLTNTPAFATNFAEGKPATVLRAEVADWLLRLPDGGAEGGESVRVLEKRSAGR